MNEKVTLQDIMNTVDMRGNATKVAEILSKSNPILKDAPWMEANEYFGYKFARRSNLPKGEWRVINSGVANEKATTQPATEVMGMLETYSEIDKALVDNHPQPAFFRMLNANGFIEGMAQSMAEGIIYQDTTDGNGKILGLASRMKSVSQPNVYDCGGVAGSLTSCYLAQWGVDKAFLFHPKSHPTKGIVHQDLGEVTLNDADAKQYQGYRDHFMVHFGVGVMDDKAIARVANIDSSKKAGEAGGFNEDILLEALNQFPNDASDVVIYVNRKLKTIMEIALKNKSNVNYTIDTGLGGIPLLRFRGVPVKTLDTISLSEAHIA